MNAVENNATPSLPTGKSHVSYSELSCWSECTWRHKLMHIDGIDLSTPTPFTIFGTAIHAACENFLRTREMDDSIAVKVIEEEWTDELEQYRLSLGAKAFDPKENWQELARRMLPDVPTYMDETFPGWEFIAAEQRLQEPIAGHDDVKFKGFIDAVISVPDKRGHKKIWVIDFKTASWGWPRQKKGDFTVQLQLRLYKHFWSQKTGTPMKDIRCGFLLIKRNAKDGKRCELVPVSVGNETTKRSLSVIDNMVFSVRRGTAIKNRESCKWCPYKDTEHCT